MLNRKVTIHLQKDEVEDVLQKIERLININFIYSPELINVKRNVSIHADDKPLGEVLNTLLNPLDINYEVAGQQIILKRKNTFLLAKHSPTLPNIEIVETAIAGTVTDEKGEPLIGVSVLLKGSTRGTTNDSNGKFKLAVSSEQAVLVFSSVGYQKLEVTVGKQTSLSIVLKADISNLGEVVVIGYGTQKKRDVTGSVSSVNTKDLKSLPVANIGEAMQGRAAGVQVVSSGSPGSNVTLRVRGTGTINNSDPLLVSDQGCRGFRHSFTKSPASGCESENFPCQK